MEDKQLHTVYALCFNLDEISDGDKPAFINKMNSIRVYGSTLPSDSTIMFYVGETQRHSNNEEQSPREKEHRYHAKTKSSIEFDYASRAFIRLLWEYEIDFETQVLKSFPIGEPVTEFEDFFVSLLASEGHPLTNLVAGLTNPKNDIQELGNCADIEEFKQKRKELKERAKRSTYKKAKNRYVWPSELPSKENQELICQQFKQFFALKAKNLPDSKAKLQYSMIAHRPEAFIFHAEKFDTDAITASEITKLVALAANNQLLTKQSNPYENMDHIEMMQSLKL